MKDYAEHLAQKSAQLAELTRALNAQDWAKAWKLALAIEDDLAAVRHFCEAQMVH